MSKGKRLHVRQADAENYINISVNRIVEDGIINKISLKYSYIKVREILKYVFDELEVEENENYIGVIEWAVTQSIIDNHNCIKKSFLTQAALDKFARHPDVEMSAT